MRLKQYLLYLNRSKVVTHRCAFCEKSWNHQFSEEDKYLLMCLTIFQVNTKRNFAFKELLHQISPWKAEGADVFLAPAFSFAKRYTGQRGLVLALLCCF